MRWFKHRCDASGGEFISELESVFGLEGYSRWFKLLEIVGSRMNESDLCSASYPWAKCQIILKGKRKKIQEFLHFCEQRGKIIIRHSGNIPGTNLEQTGKQLGTFQEQTRNKPETKSFSSGNILEIEIPNLLKMKDEYSKKSRYTPEKLRTKEVEVEVDKEKEHATPVTPSPSMGEGESEKTSETKEEKLSRLKMNPEKKWNAFLIEYHNVFGHLPTWAEGIGATKEFYHLSEMLKKLDGDNVKLFQVWKIFLRDREDYLVQNGHRPSLILKRLDGYLNNGSQVSSAASRGYCPRCSKVVTVNERFNCTEPGCGERCKTIASQKRTTTR